MCENIDVSSAAQYLMLAYQHDAAVLGDVALEFVVENLAEVARTPAWTIIKRSMPALMHDILMAVNSKPRV
jgi:hypothetical protein